jgi:hypothetical protein
VVNLEAAGAAASCGVGRRTIPCDARSTCGRDKRVRPSGARCSRCRKGVLRFTRLHPPRIAARTEAVGAVTRGGCLETIVVLSHAGGVAEGSRWEAPKARPHRMSSATLPTPEGSRTAPFQGANRCRTITGGRAPSALTTGYPATRLQREKHGRVQFLDTLLALPDAGGRRFCRDARTPQESRRRTCSTRGAPE